MGFGQDMQDSVVRAVSSLFAHGPVPMENTLNYLGDHGLIGPQSVSWRVLGDASVFVGGIRALVVQSAHPEVAAGVDDHSTYRDDPLGRLSRTSVYVTETTYGAMPEVEAAVDVVRQAHRPVRGTSERNLAYSASQPEMAAWVHNVLTDSFLSAFQAFGSESLSDAEADQFVAEQTKVGALLGADPLPETAAELRSWIINHEALAVSKAQTNAVDFLSNPPLAVPIRLGYRLLFSAATATIAPSLLTQLGLTEARRAKQIGTFATKALRWSLGSSPQWQLALVRCDEPIPPGIFRQPLPSEARDLLRAQSQ